MELTPDEQKEWDYIKTERLGFLCGTEKPSPEQVEIAEDEANEHIKQLRTWLYKT